MKRVIPKRSLWRRAWRPAFLLCFFALLAIWWVRTGGSMNMMTPKSAFEEVKAGRALLVDVREEEELKETGFAEGALWMPMSRMEEGDPLWADFQRRAKEQKHLIFYCRSGNRSGRVATFLAGEGYATSNMGGFKDWQAAQLPVKKLP
jgi:rhodanese-related sulfurtransferase